MFESVAPEKFLPRSRKVFYESLPVSIAAHALVGAAVLLGQVWDVDFPTETPRLLALYRLEEAPLPPPPPPPPPPAATARPVPRIIPKNLELAPTVVPEEIPVVTNTPVEPAPETLPIDPNAVYTEGVEGGVEGGVTGGTIGGQLGGQVGGQLGGVVSDADVPPPDTVVVKRDMPLPMAPMSMTFPKYPDDARVRGWEDRVIVRYVIGKDGRVREVTVLSRPERELFEKITVKAIRGWRFRPYKKDGVAQEVIHELTIFFKLEA
jgi:protein TonB